MNDPYSYKKGKSGPKSLLGLILVFVIIAAVIAAIACAFAFFPQQMGNIVTAIVVVIFAILLGIALIWFVLSIVVGIKKVAEGEVYQDKMSYDLDDVKAVKETSSEDKKE